MRKWGAGSAKAWWTACGWTTRTAWPTPQGYLRWLKEAHRRRLRAGGEDPGAGGGAAGRLRLRGHHRLRRAGGRGPGVRGPCRPAGAWTQLDAELRGTGDAADYAEMIRGTKRMIADGILRSEVLRLARLVPRVPRPVRGGGGGRDRRDHRLLPGLPELPAHGRRGPEGSLRVAAEHRPDLAGRGRPAAAAAGPGQPHRRPVPADLRHGDGQGRGGHRVLPLHPAGHPDRGGRGTHRVRCVRRRSSITGWPAPGRDCRCP